MSNIDFKKFLEGYLEVENNRKSLDIKDRRDDIAILQLEIRYLEESKERVGEKVKSEVENKSLQTKKYEELAKPIEDQIAEDIAKIDEYNKNKRNVNSNLEKYKRLADVKQKIRENAKEYVDELTKELYDSKSEIENNKNQKISVIDNEINEIRVEIEEATRNNREELQKMLDEEEKYPTKVKDSKYKEFLQNKIDEASKDGKEKISNLEKQKEVVEEEYDEILKNKELEIKNREQEIEVKYRELLKNFGRIDRGEEVVIIEENDQNMEEPKTVEPKSEEPKTVEPKTEEPKSEEPKTVGTKTVNTKPVEPKTVDTKTVSAVDVTYMSSLNNYLITDENRYNEEISRKQLEDEVDKQLILENVNNNFIPSIYQALKRYDEINNTKKAEEYLKISKDTSMTKEDIIKMKEESKINIKYDLRELYNKSNKLNLVERIKILNEAKKLKETELGTVKKGIVVTLREPIDRIVYSIQKSRQIKALEAAKENTMDRIQLNREARQRSEEDRMTAQEKRLIAEQDIYKYNRSEVREIANARPNELDKYKVSEETARKINEVYEKPNQTDIKEQPQEDIERE